MLRYGFPKGLYVLSQEIFRKGVGRPFLTTPGLTANDHSDKEDMDMRRTLPILILLVGLIALWGCSKKNPVQTGNLNQGQEAAFAKETGENAARVTGFVGSFENGLGSTPDTAKPFGGPLFITPSPVDTPPTGWLFVKRNPHQPTADTLWYRKSWTWSDTMGTFNDTVYVMFTPDIWGTGLPPVTRVDWEGLIYWANPSNNTSTSLDEAAWARYSSDTLHTDGSFKVVGTVKAGGSTIASYTHTFGWTNCSRFGWVRTPRTCSGTINWSATSTYVAVTYDLKGSYTFTNGSGTGEAQFKNIVTGNYITFAKFTFNSNGSGYYTLLSENWQIPHPFFW